MGRGRPVIAKRLLDILISLAALILLSPLFLFIAVAVRVSSRGPAFFRQDRVGLRGETFRIWKFRTMTAEEAHAAPLVTSSDDRRVTAVGRFLRRWKLDELPQFVNVLLGEMSIVGPRPEVRRYVAMYSDEQRRVLSVKPGMTDEASIRYADEERILAECDDIEATYVNEIMPRKLELNLKYIDGRSLWGDIALILRTAVGVFRAA